MAVVLQLGMLASCAQAQNLFVTTYTGNIIEITTGGTQSTYASGLSDPQGLAFNSAGNLFVASFGNPGNIIEITPGGARSTFASGLPGPIALAFNSAGNLFVTTYYGNIFEYTPGGAQSFFAGVPGMGGGLAMAFDSAGDLFVADAPGPPPFHPGYIFKITPGGMNNTFASGLNIPSGLAFDSAGDLFEADNGSGNIYEFTNGVATEMGTFASGLSPGALAFDSAGNLFVASGGNIYEFTNGVATEMGTFATGVSGGYLAFQPPPALAIVLFGPNVILTWPTNVTGNLQFTTNLVSSAAWNTNLPPPVVVNGQNAVTNPISGTQMFFQLH